MRSVVIFIAPKRCRTTLTEYDQIAREQSVSAQAGNHPPESVVRRVSIQLFLSAIAGAAYAGNASDLEGFATDALLVPLLSLVL
jgi:hypothetical protein